MSMSTDLGWDGESRPLIPQSTRALAMQEMDRIEAAVAQYAQTVAFGAVSADPLWERRVACKNTLADALKGMK